MTPEPDRPDILGALRLLKVERDASQEPEPAPPTPHAPRRVPSALDPRSWERRQRLALKVAAGLGSASGAFVAFLFIRPSTSMYYSYLDGYDWPALVAAFWGTILFWLLAGIATAWALVTIQVLLRRQ